MALILYVEDDAVLQLDGEIALTEAGHDVLVGRDGVEGCALLRHWGRRVDALVTDIDLCSAVDGWKVAELAREFRPELPVVYATASTSAEVVARGVPLGLLVRKPFAWPQVVRCVATLLAGRPPPLRPMRQDSSERTQDNENIPAIINGLFPSFKPIIYS
jgi:CheY-like chemotaxis protein